MSSTCDSREVHFDGLVQVNSMFLFGLFVCFSIMTGES